MFIRILICFLIISAQLPGFCAQYVYKKLNSGHTIVAAEIKDNPIVTIDTWVRTGSINEDDSNSGVAHFLEHLFFKGSKNVPPGEFDKLLESKGAITNAATSKDYTQFYITIPSSDFDLALRLHSDMLLNPLIPRKELEKERLVVLEEIARGLDNPSNIMYNNLFALMYDGHPYKRPVIGSKEIISTISREEILDFYNRWYTPSNMITVVAGDIDPNYAINEIEKAFGSNDAQKPKKVSYPSITPITKQISTSENKEIVQGYMTIAFRAPKFIDTKDAYALDILSVILGGSNSSLLNKELKEKQQLVNSISAANSQYLDDGMFAITAKFDPLKNTSLIQKEIFEEIEKVKNGGITKEDVQKAKNMISSSTGFARESAANIAGELGFFTFYYNTPKMYDEYLKKINAISLKDVISAANKYLDKDKSAISSVLPEGYVEISNAASAAKIYPDTAQTVDKTDRETKYILDNGAILIVRKNKSNSILAFDILAKGGGFLTQTPGVPYLAANGALRGTKNKTYEEINDFLDENGIRFSLSSGQDAFNISMKTTKDKLNDGLLFMDEVVNSASFPAGEIEKVKKHYREYVSSLADRPLNLAMDIFTGAAYKGYPYANNNQTVIKYIDKIERDDIIDYYDKILDSKNLVISVTGDVDDTILIKEFNKIFRDKNQKKVELKEFLKTSYVPEATVRTKIKNSGKETTWIVFGYKTCPIYNIKEVATLRVIDSLLGSGMSSRLFKSLRENQGLAYQVGTNIAQFGNDGALIAYIGTNYKNEDVAVKGINAEFERLKTEFVSTRELEEAKEKLLGNMVIALETNMDYSSFLSRYALFGFDLNFLEELQNQIKAITPSDIISFANKYFQNPHFEIIAGK